MCATGVKPGICSTHGPHGASETRPREGRQCNAQRARALHAQGIGHSKTARGIARSHV